MSAAPQARAGRRAPESGDPDLVVLAEAHILTILLAADGRPLTADEIAQQIDPECQAAAPRALGLLADQGAVEQAGSPGGQCPRWHLTRPPGGW